MNFQSLMFWKLHQLESENFLQNLLELRNFQDDHYKKAAKFLKLSSCTAGLVLVISETVVNIAHVEKIF